MNLKDFDTVSVWCLRPLWDLFVWTGSRSWRVCVPVYSFYIEHFILFVCLCDVFLPESECVHAESFVTVCHSMLNEAASALVSVLSQRHRKLQKLFEINTSVWASAVDELVEDVLLMSHYHEMKLVDVQKLCLNWFQVFEENMCCKLNKLSATNTSHVIFIQLFSHKSFTLDLYN